MLLQRLKLQYSPNEIQLTEAFTLLSDTAISHEKGKMVNAIASYADKTDGRLEILFSQVGFVYHKSSWLAIFSRYAMRGIRSDEHGFALISAVESRAPEQDMFNPLMKRMASEYVQKKGLGW